MKVCWKKADHDVPVTPDEMSHAFNIFPLVRAKIFVPATVSLLFVFSI